MPTSSGTDSNSTAAPIRGHLAALLSQPFESPPPEFICNAALQSIFRWIEGAMHCTLSGEEIGLLHECWGVPAATQAILQESSPPSIYLPLLYLREAIAIARLPL